MHRIKTVKRRFKEFRNVKNGIRKLKICWKTRRWKHWNPNDSEKNTLLVLFKDCRLQATGKYKTRIDIYFSPTNTRHYIQDEMLSWLWNKCTCEFKSKEQYHSVKETMWQGVIAWKTGNRLEYVIIIIQVQKKYRVKFIVGSFKYYVDTTCRAMMLSVCQVYFLYFLWTEWSGLRLHFHWI